MRRTSTTCASILAVVVAVAVIVPQTHAASQARPSADAPAVGTPSIRTPRFGPEIDALASDPPTTCQNGPRAGIEKFRAMALAAYPMATDAGIFNCRSTRGGADLSQHAEARAWDMGLDAGNREHRRAGDEFVAWLLAPDANGETNALARRFGVQAIIWNGHIWTSEAAHAGETGMLPYNGVHNHADHIHFSFSWAGAEGKTTFWKPGRSRPRARRLEGKPLELGDPTRHPAAD